MWLEQQQKFARALLDSNIRIPDIVNNDVSRNQAEGFNIYRNNVVVGLSDQLAATFPVAKSLVGDVFFREMAKVYIRGNLPRTPMLSEYGDTFPDMIEGFDVIEGLPYLTDVARLEWALNRAGYSADAEPLDISVLGEVLEEEIDNIRFRLHPSLRLVISEWPVVSIWQAHQQEDPGSALASLSISGERALVIRPHHDVFIRPIDASAHALLSGIMQGKTLKGMCDDMGERGMENPAAYLSGLFETGAIISLNRPSYP